MLRLVGVGKRYGRGKPVLSGLELEIEPGLVLGVVGTNGSGKSTLLRIVAGISRPSAGKVDGRPTIGYMPDRFPAATRMSAIGYLEHLGRVRGMSNVDSRAGELLERLALAGGPAAPIRSLSKGNAQKVGLAQALLAEPELLVLDEPWSGLDPAAHGVLAELIAETRERGASVVFSEHRTPRASAHASRVLLLSEGKLRPADGGHVRVVLRGAGDWNAEPDVLKVRRDGDLLELVVPPGRSDAVLSTALRRGFSVVRVET
ncbi:ABC transporter ATP-binding protein [Amycolatopsis sp. K13G38]|uniref:ABC transporter ATP-binding protein n=1 Tax=Amycolatopsis acididurans TaxID=2724524 RepID=A0ABX1J0P7_9PSEU|nr:ABC transporter ATP-binding protein [Amycolatopsis acididurans]NKQ53342.1 ABC transporter ATP-binding protein [Amycolatopsis acididurans]